jgi:hypothetical protein
MTDAPAICPSHGLALYCQRSIQMIGGMALVWICPECDAAWQLWQLTWKPGEASFFEPIIAAIRMLAPARIGDVRCRGRCARGDGKYEWGSVGPIVARHGSVLDRSVNFRLFRDAGRSPISATSRT